MKKAGPDQIPASWFRQQRLRDLQKWLAPVAEASEKLAAERAEFDGLVERMQAELAALGLSFWLPRNLTRCIR